MLKTYARGSLAKARAALKCRVLRASAVHALRRDVYARSSWPGVRARRSTLQELAAAGGHQLLPATPTKIEDMVSAINLKNIVVEGIMTIGPNTKNKKETREAFVTLRKTKETLNAELGMERLTHLSMGMSGDFEVGIEEGSTMVRLGTALFGSRETKNKK